MVGTNEKKNERIISNATKVVRARVDALELAEFAKEGNDYIVSPSVEKASKEALKKTEKEIEKVKKELAEIAIDFDTFFDEVSRDYALEKQKKEEEKIQKREEVAEYIENLEKHLPDPIEPEDPFFKRVKENSHSLKDVLKNTKKELKYNKCGVTKNTLLVETNENGKVRFLMDPKDGERDPRIVQDWLTKFQNKELKPEPYFDKKDGQIYKLVKEFYESGDSKAQTLAVVKLLRHINIMSRQVTKPVEWYKKKENFKYFGEELPLKGAVRKSYETDKPMHVPGHNGRKILKEAAWVVVHNYMCGIFLTEEKAFNLVPKGNQDLVAAWNNYIGLMNDVPSEVKQYFMLDDAAHSVFTDSVKDKYCVDFEGCMNPPEDIPFDDEKIVKGMSVDLVSTEAAKATEELNKSFHAAIENDNWKEEKQEECNKDENVKVPENNVNENSFSFGEVMNNPHTYVNPAEIAKNLAAKTVEQEHMTPVPGIPVEQEMKYNPMTGLMEAVIDPFVDNNKEWEATIFKLDKFTKIVNKLGYHVYYEMDPSLDGILSATICDGGFDLPIKKLLIDTYVMYGDTIRVFEPQNAEHDIRKELMIPVSQENLIVKLIKGTLTKEDRHKLQENLPRCLGDFREKWNFFDRISMADIWVNHRPGLQFNDWKKFVINISNVLKHSDMPKNCRFRIDYYTNPDNFKLICDDQVTSAYPTMIFTEPEHLALSKNCFFVEYNASKYSSSNNFVCGVGR